MKVEGGCYCRKIRYVAVGEPRLKAQCHCRECQYISGGAPNMFYRRKAFVTQAANRANSRVPISKAQ